MPATNLCIYLLDILGVSAAHSLAGILPYWSDPQWPIPQAQKYELGTKEVRVRVRGVTLCICTSCIAPL